MSVSTKEGCVSLDRKIDNGEERKWNKRDTRAWYDENEDTISSTDGGTRGLEDGGC